MKFIKSYRISILNKGLFVKIDQYIDLPKSSPLLFSQKTTKFDDIFCMSLKYNEIWV